VPHVALGGLDVEVTEVPVPVDPLPLIELVALFADGQEVVREQFVEPVGVRVQFGVVERPLELKNVICHADILSGTVPPGERRPAFGGAHRRDQGCRSR
jgi:hypothetical protein